MLIRPDKIYIMGILNVTPDSFSDGGEYYGNRELILHRVEQMIEEGAHIIDVGGESTRPFSEPVPLDIELNRVIPVVKMIKQNFDVLISVDSYKSRVAEESLKVGAHIINDISGFTFDEDMLEVVSRYKPVCAAMHIKGTPRDMQVDPHYEDVTGEVYDFLSGRVKALQEAGIEEIIIDPGFGFGKSLDDNYLLLNNLDRFKELGCPILAGISRKSMIGKVVVSEPHERVPGTITLDTLAILKGANIIRVHDIKESYQSIKVLERYLEVGSRQ